MFSKAYEFCDPRVHRILTGSAPRNIQPSLSPCRLAFVLSKATATLTAQCVLIANYFPVAWCRMKPSFIRTTASVGSKGCNTTPQSLKRTCCSIARAWQKKNTLANGGTVLNK